MIIKCQKCEYEWETKSKMQYVSCPNCMAKVRKNIADAELPNWMKPDKQDEDEVQENDK